MTFFSDGNGGTPSLFVQATNPWYDIRDTCIVCFVADGCRKNLPLAVTGKMSYDLYFWQQSAECDVAPDVAIQRFSESQTVDGIAPLDVSAIIARLKDVFPDITENPLSLAECPVQLIWEHDTDGTFIALPCTTYLCIESHGASNDVLNRIIDIAHEFKCPLYDPQTNERYTG